MKAFHVYTSEPTDVQLAPVLDEFAEHLSNDLPLHEIAYQMGVSPATPCVLLHMLRGRYGERAQ